MNKDILLFWTEKSEWFLTNWQCNAEFKNIWQNATKHVKKTCSLSLYIYLICRFHHKDQHKNLYYFEAVSTHETKMLFWRNLVYGGVSIVIIVNRVNKVPQCHFLSSKSILFLAYTIILSSPNILRRAWKDRQHVVVVRWHHTISSAYSFSNGQRQGGDPN